MKLITPDTQAAELKAKYLRDGAWTKWFPEGWKIDHPQLVEALFALGPDPSVADIVRIMYPTCLQPNRCVECEQDRHKCVEFGEDVDYESTTSILCAECITKALRLVTDER